MSQNSDDKIRIEIVFNAENPVKEQLVLSLLNSNKALGFRYQMSAKMAKALCALTGDPVEEAGTVFVHVASVGIASTSKVFYGDGSLLSGHRIHYNYDVSTREGFITFK